MTDDWFIFPLITLFGGALALLPLGRQVLHRGVVFIDLAVAQAAAAATLWLQVFHHTHDDGILLGASVAGALCSAALVAKICQWWPQRREALIGLIYILGALLALLAAQFSPHGKDDLQQLLAADLLWSDGTDALIAVVSGVVVSILFWFKRSVLAADMIFYGMFAVVASLMVQTLGVFLVFVLLIGPALLFERFSALLSSATLGLAVGGGLGLSWYLDLPSGICLSLTISAVSLLALRPNPGASVKL